MIFLLLKIYSLTFAYIGLFSISLLLAGCYFIFKFFAGATPKTSNIANVIAVGDYQEDIQAIAGEDLLPTRLDLAVAFLETGRIDEALNILNALLAEHGQNKEILMLINQAKVLKQTSHQVASV